MECAVAALRASGRVSTLGVWGRSMGAVTALLYSQRDPTIAGMVGVNAGMDAGYGVRGVVGAWGLSERDGCGGAGKEGQEVRRVGFAMCYTSCVSCKFACVCVTRDASRRGEDRRWAVGGSRTGAWMSVCTCPSKTCT